MRPIRLPRDIILHIVLYLIPTPALQWIQHDFHYSRHVRTPMLYEIFGTGCLPTHIDVSRYAAEELCLVLDNSQWRLPPSRLALSRNHLHDTISRLHIALLSLVYWAPMSSLSRRNVIRTIETCRRHEKHWFYLRPHYPLRTYSFTSRFIICDHRDNRVLASIEWSWRMSDITFWHACTNPFLLSEWSNGELDPDHLVTTRLIEHNDPEGNPWHLGYCTNGTPSDRPTRHLPACAFSIPMSAQHTQHLIHSIQQHRNTECSVHFDILNNDYCLTSHLLVAQIMTIPINNTQQTTQQQHQQQQ